MSIIHATALLNSETTCPLLYAISSVLSRLGSMNTNTGVITNPNIPPSVLHIRSSTSKICTDMDINKRTSELLINKMLNAQNPNSKSSDFASKMDQRGVEPLSENPFPVLLLS